MSKQLLHAYQSHVVIVALNERAFVMVKNKEDDGRVDDYDDVSLSEKKISTPSPSGAHVLELSLPVTITGDKTEDCGDVAVAKNIAQQLTDNDVAEGSSDQLHQSDTSTSNPHEIQAVCCTEIESQIWLAVSRENKTLSLYSFPNPFCQESHATIANTEVHPTITYNLPKRAKCLAFGTVPSSSLSSAPHCHVIITGDLAGDAIAYPILLSNKNNDNSSLIVTTANPSTTTNITRRLLLGHTASILTGLSVVPSIDTTITTASEEKDSPHKTQFILTADRDEKIRVSHFPETHIIHGYLFGHSSFISSMDATTTTVSEYYTRRTKPLCITGSGDGSVRLWDYQICKEVGMFPVMMKKCCSSDENDVEDNRIMTEEDEEDEVSDDDEKAEGEDECAVDDFDEEFSDDDEVISGHTIAVPISVALSPDGSNAVVARDGISSIDIHSIPSSLSQPVSLHKKVTLDCPSQPLAVKCLGDGSVLVLGRSPDYLSHFQCTHSNKVAKEASFKDMSSDSPFCIALKDAVGSDHIDMPTTTLDRIWNKVNDPDYERSQERGNGGDNEAQQKKKREDLHWNDAKRKEVDKLAQQRRKQRKREGRKTKKIEEVQN